MENYDNDNELVRLGLRGYNPNKPKITMNLPKSVNELLVRLAEAGVPLAYTLSEFAKNPDAPATETLQNVTDESVPFKWQLRTGNATPASLAEEALLMFKPIRGGNRRAVRVDKDGNPNMKDLTDWHKSKDLQVERLRKEIAQKDPTSRMPEYERALKNRTEALESSIEYVKKHASELSPRELEYQNKHMDRLREDIKKFQNIINEMAIDGLDYHHGMTLKDFEKMVGDPVLQRNKYTEDKIMKEFNSLPPLERYKLWEESYPAKNRRR